MNTITLTMEFTEENLKKILKIFKDADNVEISSKPAPAVIAKKEEPKADPQPEAGAASTAKTAGAPSQESASEKKVTREEVRAAALTLNKAGRKDIVAAVFKEFGGKKFSDFDERPEVYPEMMKKFQEASNA